MSKTLERYLSEQLISRNRNSKILRVKTSSVFAERYQSILTKYVSRSFGRWSSYTVCTANDSPARLTERGAPWASKGTMCRQNTKGLFDSKTLITKVHGALRLIILSRRYSSKGLLRNHVTHRFTNHWTNDHKIAACHESSILRDII